MYETSRLIEHETLKLIENRAAVRIIGLWDKSTNVMT